MVRLRKVFSLLSVLVLAVACQATTNPTAYNSAETEREDTPTAQPATSTVEIVAKVNQGPGNITVTPDNRIIMSLHQFFETEDRVVEVRRDGRLTPFPNPEWSRGRKKNGEGLDAVLGIQSDPNGVVWMLDNGGRSQVTPQLVGWNTRTNRLERTIPLAAPITAQNSFLNDLAVDTTNQAIYMADTALGGTPALIVVNLRDGSARRVLAGHVSVMSENVDLIVEDKPVRLRQSDGSYANARVSVNPIALDANNDWLYYGPMTGSRLYRIRTADLVNQQLTSEQLAERVENYAARPNSDGISIDRDNNIYITEIGANAIGVIRPNRNYERLFSEPWMIWPDALSFAPNGYMYSVVNQLNRTPALNAGENQVNPPFLVIRFKPMAQGIVGR